MPLLPPLPKITKFHTLDDINFSDPEVIELLAAAVAILLSDDAPTTETDTETTPTAQPRKAA